MRYRYLLAAGLALIAGVAPLAAQPVPSSQPPYNTDLGAIITNAVRVAGTNVSALQSNIDGQGLICVADFTVLSGSPSTVFSIQGYDAASATYYTIATSGAITVIDTPTALIVKPGIVAADAVSPAVAKSMPVPRAWRLSQTITGSQTAVTGKIGCNKLK